MCWRWQCARAEIITFPAACSRVIRNQSWQERTSSSSPRESSGEARGGAGIKEYTHLARTSGPSFRSRWDSDAMAGCLTASLQPRASRPGLERVVQRGK